MSAEALRLNAKIDADFIAEVPNTFKEAAEVQSNKWSLKCQIQEPIKVGKSTLPSEDKSMKH